MKKDIDKIMLEKGIDVLMVTGSSRHNPSMYYFTGGVHLTNAGLIKKRGEEPVLFCNSIERDEAKKTGLRVINLNKYKFEQLLAEAGGDYIQALVERFRLMFSDLSIKTGKVLLNGETDAGVTFAIFSALQEAIPDITFMGEVRDSTLLQAMATKDAQEINRIRRVGDRTTKVISRVAEFISSHKTEQGVLIKEDGTALTVSDVKRLIKLWLAENDLENPKGEIFSIGRDAGIPHSSGTLTDELSLGQTIVFDIYPCEAGGGYFYDITRTWCLGYAPDQVIALYEDVLSVYKQITSELEQDTLCQEYQKRTCELFEDLGHVTIKGDPETEQGYVHALGHGLGLNVHERPWFGKTATEEDRLYPGSVFTIEPGLYYPEKAMGVRLENTYYVKSDGQIEPLAFYPMDLVLPMKK